VAKIDAPGVTGLETFVKRFSFKVQ